MGNADACGSGTKSKCCVMTFIYKLAIAGLLTCMATSLWEIEKHLGVLASATAAALK